MSSQRRPIFARVAGPRAKWVVLAIWLVGILGRRFWWPSELSRTDGGVEDREATPA